MSAEYERRRRWIEQRRDRMVKAKRARQRDRQSRQNRRQP